MYVISSVCEESPLLSSDEIFGALAPQNDTLVQKQMGREERK